MHCTVQHCTALHSNALHSTAQPSNALHTAPHCTAHALVSYKLAHTFKTSLQSFFSASYKHFTFLFTVKVSLKLQHQWQHSYSYTSSKPINEYFNGLNHGLNRPSDLASPKTSLILHSTITQNKLVHLEVLTYATSKISLKLYFSPKVRKFRFFSQAIASNSKNEGYSNGYTLIKIVQDLSQLLYL